MPQTRAILVDGLVTVETLRALHLPGVRLVAGAAILECVSAEPAMERGERIGIGVALRGGAGLVRLLGFDLFVRVVATAAAALMWIGREVVLGELVAHFVARRALRGVGSQALLALLDGGRIGHFAAEGVTDRAMHEALVGHHAKLDALVGVTAALHTGAVVGPEQMEVAAVATDALHILERAGIGLEMHQMAGRLEHVRARRVGLCPHVAFGADLGGDFVVRWHRHATLGDPPVELDATDKDRLPMAGVALQFFMCAGLEAVPRRIHDVTRLTEVVVRHHVVVPHEPRAAAGESHHANAAHQQHFVEARLGLEPANDLLAVLPALPRDDQREWAANEDSGELHPLWHRGKQKAEQFGDGIDSLHRRSRGTALVVHFGRLAQQVEQRRDHHGRWLRVETASRDQRGNVTRRSRVVACTVDSGSIRPCTRGLLSAAFH